MTNFLKLLSKPHYFSAEESERISWNFSFLAYVGAVDLEMVKLAVEQGAGDNGEHVGGREASARDVVRVVSAVVEATGLVVAADDRGEQRLRGHAQVGDEGGQDAAGPELDGLTEDLGLARRPAADWSMMKRKRL